MRVTLQYAAWRVREQPGREGQAEADSGRVRKGFDPWPGGAHPELAAASTRGTPPGQGPAWSHRCRGGAGDRDESLRLHSKWEESQAASGFSPAPLSKGLRTCPGGNACDATLRPAASAWPHVPGAQTVRRLGLCHQVRKTRYGPGRALWTALVRLSVSTWSTPEPKEYPASCPFYR